MGDFFIAAGLVVAALEACAFVAIMVWAFVPPPAKAQPRSPAHATPTPSPARTLRASPGAARCWWCGVRPEHLLWSFGERTPIPLWPEGRNDHDHSIDPPTPAELVERGDRTMRRITEIWSEG